MTSILPRSLMAILGTIAFASSANSAAIVSWNGTNAIVDTTLSTTTLYGNTVPDGATNGRLVWDPVEATSPGIGVDNVTQPNSPPGATGCILAGGANCDDPRQSGKRFKLQATAPGPIDIMFDFADDSSSTAPVNGVYRIFGKIINAMPKAMSSYTLQLGTGVGDAFSLLTGTEGISFYAPQNDPAKSFELASVFPAGLFSPPGQPTPTSGEGFFSGARSGFDLTYSATTIQTGDIYGDYAALFDTAMLPLTQVPDGYFFDDDGDPATEDVLQAWYDESQGAWLYGQANGFATVDAATLNAWAADPLYYSGAIDDLANTNLNTSLVFSGAAPGQVTMRVTPSAVPVPGSALLLGSALAGVGALATIRRRFS